MRGRTRAALSRAGKSSRRAALRAAGVPAGRLLERARRLSRSKVGVALVYHCVGDPAGDLRSELLPALGSSLFAAQVRHLTRHFRLVPASQLVEAVRLRRRGEPFPVAITFDDDLPEHELFARPILERERAPATFFLTGTALRRPHRFWWNRLQAAYDRGEDLSPLDLPDSGSTSIHDVARAIEALPPGEQQEVDRRLERLVGPDPDEAGLRSHQVAGLVQAGFEVGFHTRGHVRLTELPEAELADALREGRDELETVIGRRMLTIAYPHGKADARVAAAARAAGYETGFTGSPGAVTADADPLLLPRVSPSYDSVGELAFDIAWTLVRARSPR